MKFPDSIIAGLNVEMIKYDKGLNIIHFQKKSKVEQYRQTFLVK